MEKKRPENIDTPINFVKYKKLEEKRRIAIKNRLKLIIIYPFETDSERERKLEMIIKEVNNLTKFKLQEEITMQK